MAKTRKVDVDGIGIAARVEGAEDAPWLVLSNSLGSNMSMWDPQMEALLARFRVLRYDTRGHGGSDVPEGPYGFEDFTADALGLMDHFGIEKASFMGVSLGGMTALGLGLGSPGRFERLVVADARADTPDDFNDMQDQRIAAIEKGGIDVVVEGTVEAWISPESLEARPETADHVRAMVSGTDPAGYIATCHALKRLDYLKDLPNLTVPTLYICGSEDSRTPPEAMGAMAAATPGSRYYEIEGARHLANLDRPEEFNEEALAFLAGG